MPALDAVHEQQEFFLVAQRAQAEQIFGRGRRDTAFALHAFHEDGDSRGRNRVARGGQIVERHVPEARRHRLEPLFHLVLARGRDAREGAPVKGIRRRQNFKPALVVAELARHFEQAFIRLRAAVGKKTFTSADALDEFGGKAALRFGEIKVRDVDQFARLLGERLRDGRVRVSQAADGDARAEVQVAFAGDIEKIAARAVAEHEVEAAVARHDVLLIQRLNGGCLIADDGRRCRNDLFHCC